MMTTLWLGSSKLGSAVLTLQKNPSSVLYGRGLKRALKPQTQVWTLLLTWEITTKGDLCAQGWEAAKDLKYNIIIIWNK